MFRANLALLAAFSASLGCNELDGLIGGDTVGGDAPPTVQGPSTAPDVGDLPSPVPSEACGQVDPDNAACESCFQQNCCALGAACIDAAQCPSLWNCRDECADSGITVESEWDACLARCDRWFPAGVQALDALQSCLATSCTSLCN